MISIAPHTARVPDFIVKSVSHFVFPSFPLHHCYFVSFEKDPRTIVIKVFAHIYKCIYTNAYICVKLFMSVSSPTLSYFLFFLVITHIDVINVIFKII